MINLVIPMAGIGSRFLKEGFTVPKYMLPINKDGMTMIEGAILSLNIDIPFRIVFIIRDDKELINYLSHICTKHKFDYEIVSIGYITDGPATTVFLANIKNEYPLLIINCDQIVEWNFKKFTETCEKYDGCVLTYTPEYDLVLNSEDKHSFILTDENGKSIKLREKIVISENALVGIHYIKNFEIFKIGYQEMKSKNIKAPNGEFYISLLYDCLINTGYKIGVHKLSNEEKYHSVGEPKDYYKYINANSTYTQSV